MSMIRAIGTLWQLYSFNSNFLPIRHPIKPCILPYRNNLHGLPLTQTMNSNLNTNIQDGLFQIQLVNNQVLQVSTLQQHHILELQQQQHLQYQELQEFKLQNLRLQHQILELKPQHLQQNVQEFNVQSLIVLHENRGWFFKTTPI